ncbi:Retroviral aspartyl protease [Corchorus olitorius]|uniref:Retroviral aspartyl protease n=1 Tax=Corchorus olitorius TaxID=93759 RepID=A0A1R3G204_9ROSI|nr:Retroviral aspartyl protease [Corchorus olitorius]
MTEFREMLEMVVAKHELSAKSAEQSPMSDALEWQQYLINTMGDINALPWTNYATAMRERFASNEFSDPLAELVALKHTGLSIFTGNLKVEVARQLKLYRPQTLNQEMVQNDPEFIEQLVVLLHAIYGTSGFQTMRIICKIKNHTLIALVDSGSTHFISTSTAKFLGLFINSKEKTDVSVANGASMTSLGRCSGLQWESQGLCFSSDFLVIPVKGCDIVLGIKWLVTLGPILWDFEALNMQF